MFGTTILFAVLSLVFADEPIVQLSAICPKSDLNSPQLVLKADVPAYALAKCRNGDKQLAETDEVTFTLDAVFVQSYQGDSCLFFKKEGSNTYTLDVEVGWGERDSKIIQQKKIHTISCAYDDHGRALSSTRAISDWFLNPWEAQTLLGGNSTATFSLKLLDVLDREITSDNLAIGRKIRLMAEDLSDNVPAFRALSCSVRNSVSRYYVLRAGCGDGLVFPKVVGFQTVGRKVFSPYFDTFKLSGGDDTLKFECRFTNCNGPCDGDSCSVEIGASSRPKRSILGPMLGNYYIGTSQLFTTV